MESPTTTELPRLPGLEVPEVQATQPSGERGRWIERGPSGKLMLFSGRSNPDLALRIADQLNIELGEVELETFENGETYCRFRGSIRGADVFIVQSCHGKATNDHLLELVIMIQAAKLASANRITAVMPWFPYSRQDKKSSPREPITARLVADMLEAAGVDRVLTMDLHAGQIQGFFNVPVDHMTALPLFAQYYRDKGLYGEGVVVVSPDPGRAKMATKFAEMLEAEFALMRKTRPAHDVAAVTEVSGRVAGKTAIMTDDIIVTGGTLIAGAQALREQGATEVYSCATHALVPEHAFERLGKSQQERLLGRVRVRDLRRREPALLTPSRAAIAIGIWWFTYQPVSSALAFGGRGPGRVVVGLRTENSGHFDVRVTGVASQDAAPRVRLRSIRTRATPAARAVPAFEGTTHVAALNGRPELTPALSVRLTS
jgi:ribose-phosphate pyrophosphokinase